MNDNIDTAILPEGHPVQIYYEEKDLIHTLLEELSAVDATVDLQQYINIFNQLYTIEKRFARKENQLFPFFLYRTFLHHRLPKH